MKLIKTPAFVLNVFQENLTTFSNTKYSGDVKRSSVGQINKYIQKMAFVKTNKDKRKQSMCTNSMCCVLMFII